jgi:ABC-type sugar transport system substrate-binding protein
MLIIEVVKLGNKILVGTFNTNIEGHEMVGTLFIFQMDNENGTRAHGKCILYQLGKNNNQNFKKINKIMIILVAFEGNLMFYKYIYMPTLNVLVVYRE